MVLSIALSDEAPSHNTPNPKTPDIGAKAHCNRPFREQISQTVRQSGKWVSKTEETRLNESRQAGLLTGCSIIVPSTIPNDECLVGTSACDTLAGTIICESNSVTT